VVRWLEDDPFPRAEVRELDPLGLDGSTPGELDAAEAVVRATIAKASEFVELPWSADTELSQDESRRIWQLAGIAPLSTLDQYALLRSTTAAELLARLVEETQAVELLFNAGWASDSDGDSDLPE